MPQSNGYRHTYAPGISYLSGKIYLITLWYFGNHYTLRSDDRGWWWYRDRRLLWLPVSLTTTTSTRQISYPEVTPTEAINVLKRFLISEKYKVPCLHLAT